MRSRKQGLTLSDVGSAVVAGTKVSLVSGAGLGVALAACVIEDAYTKDRPLIGANIKDIFETVLIFSGFMGAGASLGRLIHHR